MIERIYIPTVKRADNQITYNNLPDELKKRVVMVIRPDDRHLYDYDCEYLVVPDEMVGRWTELAETRLFIHKHAGTIKYCIADDDIIIRRRNSKYWSDVDNMEMSKRDATPEEISIVFNTMSDWLDEDDIGITGFADSGSPPTGKEYIDTVGVFSIVMYDGRQISEIINDVNVTEHRTCEDIVFLLECLSRGINTRLSSEWLHDNRSMYSFSEMKHTRVVWTKMYEEDEELPPLQDYVQHPQNQKALKRIKERFPDAIKLFEKDGLKKHRMSWKKAYNKPLLSKLFE